MNDIDQAYINGFVKAAGAPINGLAEALEKALAPAAKSKLPGLCKMYKGVQSELPGMAEPSSLGSLERDLGTGTTEQKLPSLKGIFQGTQGELPFKAPAEESIIPSSSLSHRLGIGYGVGKQMAKHPVDSAIATPILAGKWMAHNPGKTIGIGAGAGAAGLIATSSTLGSNVSAGPALAARIANPTGEQTPGLFDKLMTHLDKNKLPYGLGAAGLGLGGLGYLAYKHNQKNKDTAPAPDQSDFEPGNDAPLE